MFSDCTTRSVSNWSAIPKTGFLTSCVVIFVASCIHVLYSYPRSLDPNNLSYIFDLRNISHPPHMVGHSLGNKISSNKYFQSNIGLESATFVFF